MSTLQAFRLNPAILEFEFQETDTTFLGEKRQLLYTLIGSNDAMTRGHAVEIYIDDGSIHVMDIKQGREVESRPWSLDTLGNLLEKYKAKDQP
jgi:hypothetical protein